jgi:hypothetical protein
MKLKILKELHPRFLYSKKQSDFEYLCENYGTYHHTTFLIEKDIPAME